MKADFMRNWAPVQAPKLARCQLRLGVDVIREREDIRWDKWAWPLSLCRFLIDWSYYMALD